MELYSAAASNAATAGINAKDAICLKLVGKTVKSDDHQTAVKELSAAGKAGDEVSATLRRLLSLKSQSQYMAGPISAANAAKSVGWATRMRGAAQIVLSG